MDVVSSSHPPVYTEAYWNESSVNEVREKGKDSSTWAKYSASKTLAEKGKIVSMPKFGRPLIFGDSNSCVGFLQQEQVFNQLGSGGFEPSLCVRREYIAASIASVSVSHVPTTLESSPFCTTCPLRKNSIPPF
jgi:hypothetical protein